MPIERKHHDSLADRARHGSRSTDLKKSPELHSTPLTFIFPGCCTRCRSVRPSRRERSPSSIPSRLRRCPAYVAILHRGNIGKIFRSIPGPGFSGICEERRPPFEDDVIRYYGQYIALAVAETFETAKAAADAVRATYAAEAAERRTAAGS